MNRIRLRVLPLATSATLINPMSMQVQQVAPSPLLWCDCTRSKGLLFSAAINAHLSRNEAPPMTAGQGESDILTYDALKCAEFLNPKGCVIESYTFSTSSS